MTYSELNDKLLEKYDAIYEKFKSYYMDSFDKLTEYMKSGNYNNFVFNYSNDKYDVKFLFEVDRFGCITISKCLAGGEYENKINIIKSCEGSLLFSKAYIVDIFYIYSHTIFYKDVEKLLDNISAKIDNYVKDICMYNIDNL